MSQGNVTGETPVSGRGGNLREFGCLWPRLGYPPGRNLICPRGGWMARNRIACALAIGAMLVFATPAQADIKAFNAAIAKGDYKAAAAEAETTWGAWNKSDKDTALV